MSPDGQGKIREEMAPQAVLALFNKE